MIRSYEVKDRARLIDIFNLNTPKYFHPNELSDLEKYLDNHGENHYVLEYKQEVVGCVGYAFEPDANLGIIAWIFMDPKHQGSGFGRRAVNFCLDKFNAISDVTRIRVRTSQHVYQFFEKLGFQLMSTEKDYWAPGFDLYLMEMDK